MMAAVDLAAAVTSDPLKQVPCFSHLLMHIARVRRGETRGMYVWPREPTRAVQGRSCTGARSAPTHPVVVVAVSKDEAYYGQPRLSNPVCVEDG